MTDNIVYLPEKAVKTATLEYAAIKLWNKKQVPICPGLGKKGRHLAKPLSLLTSNSYGWAATENA